MKKLSLISLAFLILSINSPAQIITTICGTGIPGNSGNGGLAVDAEIAYPKGIAINKSGDIYIVQLEPSSIRKIGADGIITHVAGLLGDGYWGDGGPAVNASLNTPHDIEFDRFGNLYIADASNNVIRRIDTFGNISTVAGNTVAGYSGDGGPATLAKLNTPSFIAVDTSGNLYISNTVSNNIRKVDMATGVITTVVGSAMSVGGFGGDGGPASAALLNRPYDIIFDYSNNLYICDLTNCRIRKVDGTGTISTVGGSALCGFEGDGGPAVSAKLNGPCAITIASDNAIYFIDGGNKRIRKIAPDGTINSIAGDGTDGFSGDGGDPAVAKLFIPISLTTSQNANLYISDCMNNRIREIRYNVGVQLSVAPPSVSLMPNPCHNLFKIELDGKTTEANIVIHDVAGRPVTQLALTKSTTVDFPEPPGIYYVSVITAMGNQTLVLWVK